MIQIETELPDQKIAAGSWNKTIGVKYFTRGKFQSTLTKKQALEKFSDSTKSGFKVITGVLINGKNYLLVVNSK